MKNKKPLFIIFSLVCFAAAGICLIVNMAISQQITWAAYPLASIALGWAVLSPLLAKKRGVLLSLGALTALLIPYLFVISRITPVTDWFIPLGLPIAITCVAVFWILFWLFRFSKMNAWYKAAITVFLNGVVLSTAVAYFVGAYVGENSFAWYNFMNIFVHTVTSVVLGIIGFVKSKPKHKAASQ